MGWALRLFDCAGCGTAVLKRASATATVRCINCSIERSVVNIHQMRARRGTFYDNWAAGLARAAAAAQARVEETHIEDRRG